MRLCVVDYITRNAKSIFIHLMSTEAQITRLFGKTSNFFFSEKITLENSEGNIKSNDTLESEELNYL